MSSYWFRDTDTKPIDMSGSPSIQKKKEIISSADWEAYHLKKRQERENGIECKMSGGMG